MDKNPKIENTFLQLTDKYKAGSPMNENTVWIDMPLVKIINELSETIGINCSNYLCKQLLEKNKFGRRKMSKAITLKNAKDRNEQFISIFKYIEQYKISNNPIISIDTKKKELIGNFYRNGRCYCNIALKVYDHDFNTFSSGTIVPHGIYDLKNNIGYMTLSESKDTGEFSCDCIKNWWINYGKELYPNADSILILCDGGGSNSSRGFLFKEDIQKLSNEIGIEIRIAHYPPYTSKHNPIEHKLFPHVTRSLNGVLIDSIETMASKIKNTTTSKGLKVVVNISKKIYETGRKATENFCNDCTIIYDKILGKWNYKAIPLNR